MLNIVIFGPPGAGKGTQSKHIVEEFGLIHLSTGDMLRSEIASGSELGEKVKSIIAAGALVSDEIVIELIRKRLIEHSSSYGFIFDGFPRTIEQAEALDNLLAEQNESISTMLSMVVPEEELVTRLIQRGKDSGRADDNEETIRKRIKEYENKTLPVAGYYKGQGKLEEVNGMGSIDEITARIINTLKKV